MSPRSSRLGCWGVVLAFSLFLLTPDLIQAKDMNCRVFLRNPPDVYRVLGISRWASLDQANAAFKTLALYWHPDKNKEPEAVQKFQELGDAIHVSDEVTIRKTAQALIT